MLYTKWVIDSAHILSLVSHFSGHKMGAQFITKIM